MRRLPAVLAAVAAGLLALSVLSGDRTAERPGADGVDGARRWATMDAQARCDDAAALVTHPDRWPVRCRWRSPAETLEGQAFPPPPGPPPFDDPHVAIFVAPDQTREQLASAIAHELGHMHHTREARFVPDWLAARNLPAATPDEVWAEDYAEVFAALFAPTSGRWRAPTPRPTPEALAALRAQFFS